MSSISGGASEQRDDRREHAAAPKNVAIVTIPSRPSALARRRADATLTKSSETTSGTTVIRIAATHSWPIGLEQRDDAERQACVPRR